MAHSINTLLAAAASLALVGGCAGWGNSPWGPQCGCYAVNDAGAASGKSTAASAAHAKAPLGERAVAQADAKSAIGSAARSASPDNVVIRGQSPGYSAPGYAAPGFAAPGPYSGAGYPSSTLPGGYSRAPQPVSGGAPATTAYAPGSYAAAPATGVPAAGYSGMMPAAQPGYAYQPSTGPAPQLPAPPADSMSGIGGGGISPIMPGYPGFEPPSNVMPEIPATPTPLDVFVEETRTGQFMFGVTVNSNAGLVGNIVISERNFDITRPPTSWDDVVNGTAFRGAGQGFRLEAQPGTVLQRYLVSFTEPYLFGSDISFDTSGYYYNRSYFDWTEARVGGRLAVGRRLTPDLSLAAALRLEDVDIFQPRVIGVPALDSVLGHSDLYSGRVTLTHDTRDIPFSPTQGHLITASFEQAFGEFSFPRGDFEYAQYVMVRQRPDGSGRHTAAFITKLGISGSGTPIFENYFAGGFSTIRGFSFRGASPRDFGVIVGGRFQWLNSLEYYFPLTADDMIRGTVFCDFGTVEQNVAVHPNQFRAAPGVGLRINIPAMGPAPLAFDFAFPVAQADTDQKQVFSFFFGASR